MRASRILLPEDGVALQGNLFGATGVSATPPGAFPTVHRDEVGVLSVIANSRNFGKAVGLDFEFSPSGKPSIMGVASRAPLAAAVPYDINLCQHVVDYCLKNDTKLVGHNAISTEKILIEKSLGRKLPLSLFEDSMLEHYLLNQDFCKNTDKEEDEGSLGFMNLWAMASMTTDLPQWKICRGRACDGPCPRHNVFGYCAVDAYASVEGHAVMQADMARYGIPYQFYRELVELSEVCYEMETAGLHIDLSYIDSLNAQMDAAKEALFPYEMEGKTRIYKDFNPRSRDQILSWFGERGLHFAGTEKKYIAKVLERLGAKSGYPDFKLYLDFLAEQAPTTEPLKQLYDLYQFKSSGKGTDPWFGEKYRQGDYIHPRFIDTGTCTGRLASSRPNFTNIPARGWGSAIKKAIIPRNADCDFLEVDASQLELRFVLYEAGLDPSEIGADAFTWMVEQGAGLFEKATMSNFTARDVAKSVSYGSLYGEGIKFLDSEDLGSAKTRRDIINGCLRVYDDWEFRGKVVAFTGANLAERFFGSRTDENRRKALEIQEDLYFAKFPIIRQWHRKILAEIESSGVVHSTTGRLLRLYGEDLDDAKMAFSFRGQGGGADHIQAIMLLYGRRGIIPDLMVHDSLLFEIPKCWANNVAVEFLRPMFSETWRFPGLAVPGKPKRGPNYGELHAI